MESPMQNIPMQIVFRDVDPSPAVETKVRSLGNKLGRLFDRILGCSVVIESPHRHQNKGRLYHVRIDLSVPNAELVVSREHAEKHSHEDVYVAIRDAFKAIKKQLQHYTEQRRGHVKHHESPLAAGRIIEIYPMANYGVIETSEGRLINFSTQSVVNFDMHKIEVGHRARFSEAKSNNENTVASTVYIEE